VALKEKPLSTLGALRKAELGTRAGNFVLIKLSRYSPVGASATHRIQSKQHTTEAQETMAEHEAGRATQHQPVPAPSPEAWIKTELARHPQRPYPMDFIEALFTDFSEIHGDRAFSDDAAMLCGMARFHGEPVLVIGNLKGRTLKERVARKFGSPDPEGYRKALRAMRIAEKFGRPVFTFLDLAGANPGLGAEERGQGEAIARNLLEMSRLRVPTIATITGEGGSGGALALAVADRVLMLENAIYSVISPEGCASIMWKDASKKQQAAAALKYTAVDVKLMGCVDDVLPEPQGGTHNDPVGSMVMVDKKLQFHLAAIRALPLDELLEQRYQKFRNIAQFYTTA
jgi:acetyl-CoA carboxylase carboxyl transferase subunit alpha